MKMLQTILIVLLFPVAFMACKKDSDRFALEGVYVGELTQKNNSGLDTFPVKLTIQPANTLELISTEVPDSVYRGSWKLNNNILTGHIAVGSIAISISTTFNSGVGTITGTWTDIVDPSNTGTINVTRKEPITIAGHYDGFIGPGNGEPINPYTLSINDGNIITDNDGYSGAGNLNGNKLTATLIHSDQSSYSINVTFDAFLGVLYGTWEDTDQPPHKGRIRLIKK